MYVRDIMADEVTCCEPTENLEFVANLMQDQDCGCIPVTDDAGHAIGVITDRDVAMAAAARHKALWEMMAGEFLTNGVYTCRPDDDIRAALGIMMQERVRRLPVVNTMGVVEGMLSLDDVIAFAERGVRGAGTPELSYDDAINALKVVSKHH